MCVRNHGASGRVGEKREDLVVVVWWRGGGYNFSSNVILQNRFRIIQKEGEGGWVGG